MVLGMRITCQWVHGTKPKEHLPFQHSHKVSYRIGMFPEKKVRFEKDETSPELAFVPAPQSQMWDFSLTLPLTLPNNRIAVQ